MRRLSLKMDAGLYAWLKSEFRRRGKSKSVVVRAALEESRRKSSLLSCHDLMRDVCGSIRGMPRDFASNKRYLQRIGKLKK